MKSLITVDYEIPREQHLKQLAEKLAAELQAGMVLTFSGEIGSGKTSFIRAMLRALGITGAIKSPTYSIVESYALLSFAIHHFDLYRIQDEDELQYIGFREYMNAAAVCCIEWPRLAHKSISGVDLHFTLAIQGDGRHLCIEAMSERGENILKKCYFNPMPI